MGPPKAWRCFMYGRGVVDGALRDADRLRPDGGPAAVERVHGDREALALLADAVRRRDADLVEHDLAGRAAPHAQLVLVLGDADPPLLLDQEARDAAPAGVGVGLGEDDVDVGDPGVGDPVLRAGQDVVVAVAHRPRAHGGHVAAGVGLGQAVAGLDLAGRHPWHVGLLQLLAAPVHDRQHPELGDEDGQRRRRADAGQLLDGDGLGDGVRAGAAVGLGDAEGGQLHLLAGLEGLPRELGRCGRPRPRGAPPSPRRRCAGVARNSRWTSVRAKVEALTGPFSQSAIGRPFILLTSGPHCAERWRISRSDSSTGAISGIQCDTFSSTSKV